MPVTSRPARGRAPAPRTLLATVILMLGITVAATGCGEGDPADRGETIRLVFPAGSSEAVDRGRTPPGIPDRIEAEVGDTLLVENRDSATQFISGFAVSPGQTMRIPLIREGTYLTNCSAHRDRSIEMVVSGNGAVAGTRARELFDSNGCAGCHTLAEAEAEGPVGPSLDEADLGVEAVRERIEQGGPTMPAYADRLTRAEIDELAEFVSGASRP